MRKRILDVLVVTLGTVGLALFLSAVPRCTPATTALAKGAVVVAADVCRELADAGVQEPDWVTLACKADGVAEPVVVRMRRQAWYRASRSEDGGAL